MKITIIGNITNPNGNLILDGARVKVALYEKVLVNEGYDVSVLELNNWKRKPFKLINEIYHATRKSDVILIMAGPKGARVIIPLCNFFNRKKRTRIIYPMIGTGTINRKIRKLSIEEFKDFMQNPQAYAITDKRMRKYLAKLDLVLPQNETLANCYKEFYCLNNVEVINNFRYYENRRNVEKNYIDLQKSLNFVFFARVSFDKGIFDAIDAVQQINEENKNLKCNFDIYGELQLSDEEFFLFNKKLNENIKYKGTANNDDVLDVLSKYDFLLFPTKYKGEGTPGTVVEALIAGVPILISNYSQVSDVVQDNYNGVLFEMGNVLSLKNKIQYIIGLNKDEMNRFRNNAYQSGNRFTYEYNREKLLSYIIGDVKLD